MRRDLHESLFLADQHQNEYPGRRAALFQKFAGSNERNKQAYKQISIALCAIMNIDHIQTFLSVYRAKSFVAVAKDRNVAPSSVTRAVAALEASLKTRLFHRSTRSLVPTEAGEQYFEKMVPILDAFNDVNDALLQNVRRPSGLLRISASVTYGQTVIAPKIAGFRKLYPEIQLDLQLSDRRIDILSEPIDLAIRHGRLPDSSLAARKLVDVTYRLVASPTYLSSHSPIQTPEDLIRHALVCFPYDDFRHEWTFKNKTITHTLPIDPAVTISNAAAICQSVRAGAGIALLPDWTADDELAVGRLVQVLPNWRASGAFLDSAIWIIYPSNRFVPGKTRAFVDFLLNAV